MVHLTRKTEFSASHVCRIADLSDEDNFRIFGKSSYPNGHGHNYVLEVTVKGEPDPETGMVINLTDLDIIIKKYAADLLDHRFLNIDIPHFKEHVPTTENISLFIWDSIKGSLKGCELHMVRLYETPELYVEYYGE